jgi:alkaline phosphatase
MKKIMTALAFTGLSLSCSSQTDKPNQTLTSAVTPPKNIIMIVGDGMGPAYTTAYRYLKDDIDTPLVENTVFDRTLVGMSSTYPDLESDYVTDSAASATALSSAIKTYNGAIGVNINKEPVESVLAYAKKIGKKTGVVVTSQINHATPASYLAHNESRNNYNEIADSYIDDGIKADLYLGGGWQYFIRKDRNLVEEFKQKGFHYIDDYKGLSSIPSNKPLLGLFGKKGLPWAIDDTNKYRLSAMTKAATSHLSNDKGYFMLVEASQVDWGGHSNDINSAMAEMDDLAKTLEYLEKYVAENPDTLVVLTADHSTGGLTVGAKGVYEWRPNVIKHMSQSTSAIAAVLEKEDITQKKLSEMMNFGVTKEEISELIAVKSKTLNDITLFMSTAKTSKSKKYKPNLKKQLYKALNKIIDKRTNTGWTSSGHTAIDVQVFAFGQGSELFNGYQDNTDIAKKIFKLLGK